MAIIAGIDEAGVGPVLGPLVMCTCVFEVPDAKTDTCMWKLLAPAITKKHSKKSSSVAIGDSKKLFKRTSGNSLANLEKPILAMLKLAGIQPPSLADFLEKTSRDSHIHAANYPWYNIKNLALPYHASSTDINLTANAISVAMEKAAVKFHTMRCEAMFTGEFNRMVNLVNNKATTVIQITSRLIAYLWGQLKSGQMRIYVDRQGGRTHYLDMLETIFPECGMKILQETPDASIYEIYDRNRTVQIHFTVGAEEKYMPVALSSMTAKYVRELCMEMFNSYWAKHVQDIQPTAGYYTDGNRFFGEIQTVMEKIGIDKDIIYRSR